ncbi:hypothetical protein [Sphingobium olei]|uniref:Uncharacterized protein n=1 Tax=Sphingobium olei TaxID=420955 RepID=A0ABW3NZV8_9SPHN|nr:hypothetical protein [Sphingobium sp.]
MNEVDIAALESLAQGNGELRVSKRLLRGMLAKLRANEAADRSRAMVDRMIGTVAA